MIWPNFPRYPSVATADGTAKSGADFIKFNKILQFDTGAVSGTTQKVAISITDDSTTEGDEDFSVKLTATSADTVISGTATVIIQDNDCESEELSTGIDCGFCVNLCYLGNLGWCWYSEYTSCKLCFVGLLVVVPRIGFSSTSYSISEGGNQVTITIALTTSGSLERPVEFR